MASWENQQFRTPQEELAYLRAQVHEKETALERMRTEAPEHGHETAGSDIERENATREALNTYHEQPSDEILDPHYKLSEEELDRIVFELSPEEHDTVMEELLWVLEQKGVKNALAVAAEMHSPHIEDDFHRILAQYVKNTRLEERIQKEARAFAPFRTTLYEVSFPESFSKNEPEKGLKELLSNMEQFYAGMGALGARNNSLFTASKAHFSLEVALPNIGEQISFYVAVPDDACGMFEKQVLSLFHNAKLEVVPDDYNIFNTNGAAAGAYAFSITDPIFPIRTYDSFDHDPMNVILNAFSKLQEEGEGLAVQYVLTPSRKAYVVRYEQALKNIREGMPVREAIQSASTLGGFAHTAKNIFLGTKKRDEPFQREQMDQDAMERISTKVSRPIMETTIRIIASAETGARADQIVHETLSAFRQFNDPRGGGLRFETVPSRKMERFARDFSFREFSSSKSIPLNTRELTTLIHFPEKTAVSEELKRAGSSTAPAPMNLSPKGVLLGTNEHRGSKKEVRFAPEDRVRHFYVIGQTGTGKTTLLKNMIVQDIKNGEGVCMIDPHGTDIEDILANIPEHRLDDVIYFDPSHTPRPMGLNMLEYSPDHPEQKTFVVNEMLSIFNKLFDMKVAGGPMFEQYFRNAVMLVLEDPASGSTLLDVSRVLSDARFRELKLSRCRNPVVIQFWKEIASQAGGEASLQNIVPYITSKFDVFLSNDIMRPIIAQQHSAFNFRKVMDERKILLVNLSKGRLGDINAHLIGLILVGKILMAALSRVDAIGTERPADFYLYIDEFQNITTDSISTILSEARKYRLSLNMAHQFIAQLDEGIRDSVFGNVGSMAAFRVGAEDAEMLERQFGPTFEADDIMRLTNHNALLRMLVDGQPVKPFNIRTTAPDPGVPEMAAKIKALSYAKYGRAREEIENEILERYKRPIKSSPQE